MDRETKLIIEEEQKKEVVYLIEMKAARRFLSKVR